MSNSISQKLDTALIENDLRLDADRPCGKLEWLEESYRNPEDFRRRLKRTFDSYSPIQSGSALFDRYSLFFDIIIRNRNNTAPALCTFSSFNGHEEITYNELGALALQKASFWAHICVKAGHTICIIRPVGVEMIVELLAGLIIGCRMSFLPPAGKHFLRKRLEALHPDHIAIDVSHFPLLPEASENVLPEDKGGEASYPEVKEFYTYLAEEPVFSSFGAGVTAAWLPENITANAVYLCALRDGILGLGLGPGRAYAAPGFHLPETAAALFLSGLLCGATYVHLLPEDIAANPELVIQKKFKSFGVSRKVRDILLQSPFDIDHLWESWFRNPAESTDLEQWQVFIRDLKLENSYAFNLQWHSFAGGCCFHSIGRKGMAHMNVLPAPGSRWFLGDPLDESVEAIGDMGVFCFSRAGPEQEEMIHTSALICRNRGEWILSATTTIDREGRVYPVNEVLEVLQAKNLLYSLFFSIIDVPPVGSGNGVRFDLLVFTGGQKGIDEAQVAAKIRERIDTCMGDEYQPDRIVFFPLFPRLLANMEVDHYWCRRQYLTGALFRRSHQDIFDCITRLRGALFEEKAA